MNFKKRQKNGLSGKEKRWILILHFSLIWYYSYWTTQTKTIEVFKLDNIKFTPQDILHKQFKERNIGKGYDEADVDAFLDDVIKDYDTYNKELERFK